MLGSFADRVRRRAKRVASEGPAVGNRRQIRPESGLFWSTEAVCGGRRYRPSVPAIDPHLAAAVHLSVADRAGFDAAAGDEAAHHHSMWQVSTIAALMDGIYDGDLTIGELLVHGDLGLGTLQHHKAAPPSQ